MSSFFLNIEIREKFIIVIKKFIIIYNIKILLIINFLNLATL